MPSEPLEPKFPKTTLEIEIELVIINMSLRRAFLLHNSGPLIYNFFFKVLNFFIMESICSKSNYFKIAAKIVKKKYNFYMMEFIFF